MASPANIRISAQFPFPALVVGGAPVTVTKQNGIWTIALNVAGLGQQTPPPGNYGSDFFLIYDAVAATFFKVPLSALPTIAGTTVVRAQRSAIATPIVVVGTDQIINCNINVAAACALPAAAGRNGLPLTFADVGLQFAAHNLTITPNGAERIVNAANPASLVLNNNGQTVTLNPFNDGVGSGWFIT